MSRPRRVSLLFAVLAVGALIRQLTARECRRASHLSVPSVDLADGPATSPVPGRSRVSAKSRRRRRSSRPLAGLATFLLLAAMVAVPGTLFYRQAQPAVDFPYARGFIGLYVARDDHPNPNSARLDVLFEDYVERGARMELNLSVRGDSGWALVLAGSLQPASAGTLYHSGKAESVPVQRRRSLDFQNVGLGNSGIVVASLEGQILFGRGSATLEVGVEGALGKNVPAGTMVRVPPIGDFGGVFYGEDLPDRPSDPYDLRLDGGRYIAPATQSVSVTLRSRELLSGEEVRGQVITAIPALSTEMLSPISPAEPGNLTWKATSDRREGLISSSYKGVPVHPFVLYQKLNPDQGPANKIFLSGILLATAVSLVVAALQIGLEWFRQGL